IIREGMAVCITDAEEMLELCGPLNPHAPVPEQSRGLLDDLDPYTARVPDAFPARSTTTVESLVHVAGLDAKEVMRAIGNLQLAGRVRQQGGMWKRVSSPKL